MASARDLRDATPGSARGAREASVSRRERRSPYAAGPSSTGAGRADRARAKGGKLKGGQRLRRARPC
eukprot:11341089-Alexandrium_andersonii.AAC.1